MPTCKNDCKRYFRGDEPSPKGLGYCAHAEKINQRRKGRDGQFWIVKAITMKSGKRIRRWTRVKKVATKKRKTTKKKSKLKGGVNPYAGRALARIVHERQQHIKHLKQQARKCNEEEDRIRREHDGESQEVKKAALASLKKSCDKIYDELKRLGALR